MAVRYYTEQTLKRLWGLSGNECYMPGCSQQLAYPDREAVLGEIAHIRGLNPSSARHVPSYPLVNGFANLVLLCPTHHALVDDVYRDEWTVERLITMKRKHEDERHRRELSGNDLRWVVDRVLRRLVAEALAGQVDQEIQPDEIAFPWGTRLAVSKSTENPPPARRSSVGPDRRYRDDRRRWDGPDSID